MVITLPLAPVSTTVARIVWIIELPSAAVVIVGVFIALFSIRSSLKPLCGIENAAHAVVDGDFSRRAPKGQKGSEVGGLTGSISVMPEQAEQSSDVKEYSEKKTRQFVSDAPHELRTPLAAIRGYAKLYRTNNVPDCETSIAMDGTEPGTQHMSSLVEGLLQLAHLGEKRPFSLKDI